MQETNQEGFEEVLASAAASYVRADFTLTEDGFYRFGLTLHLSWLDTELASGGAGKGASWEAEVAAIDEALAWLNDPAIANPDAPEEELAVLRRQLDERRRQAAHS